MFYSYGLLEELPTSGGGATFISAWALNSNIPFSGAGTYMYRKNVAGQFVCFQMLLTASGAVATGLSPTVRRCIDGTFAAGGGTVTEDGTTGSYKYAMTQADTNGNDISFIFTATGAMPVCISIITTAADPTAATNFGITNIDGTVTSRMATYTQPTGFLAATFPTTVASTTNITSITGNITGNLSGSVGSVTARVTANTDQFNGDATAAANIAKTTKAIVRATASGVPTTTSIPTSACTPAGIAADQFKGRIITFDADTTTTALRGQATDITASSAASTPTFTVTALTTAPVSGDTFSIT